MKITKIECRKWNWIGKVN